MSHIEMNDEKNLAQHEEAGYDKNLPIDEAAPYIDPTVVVSDADNKRLSKLICWR